MGDLEQKDMEFIRRKKAIEYKYAEPYLSPCTNPELENENHLRSRVREGLEYLSCDEKADMMKEKHDAYYDIYTPSYASSPNLGMAGSVFRE